MLDAGVNYGHSIEDNSTYAGLVFGHSANSPAEFAAAGLEFLERWGAFHYSQRTRRVETLSEVLPSWFERNLSLWEPLHKKAILNFTPEDTVSVYRLAQSLYREDGLTSTEFGKLLHFVSPLGIVMWDHKWVRKNYELEEGPREFLFYQQALQGILYELIRREGREMIASLASRHKEVTGCLGGIAKLLDEAVYDNRSRAMIGRWILQAVPSCLAVPHVSAHERTDSDDS
ncbi:MAG: VanZ family protein [Thermoplasmata archaeon]|nr:VanZ family protein [Thermoplasmata archaeon]